MRDLILRSARRTRASKDGRRTLRTWERRADLARGADDLDAPRADELVKVHGDVIRRGRGGIRGAVLDAADDDRAPIGRAAVMEASWLSETSMFMEGFVPVTVS